MLIKGQLQAYVAYCDK